MNTINPELLRYLQLQILPEYEKNDAGHSAEHIEYVLNRSLLFAEQFEKIDINIVYTVAAFHDIGHYIDKKNHEKLSAQMFFADDEMKRFFTDKERLIIKEAIEDHRASSDNIPRSDYGKIISSADRSTDADEFLRRTHAYTLKYFPGCSEAEAVSRAYDHTAQKYGITGYAKHYVKDSEYDEFREYINLLLQDKNAFEKKYRDVNGL